MNKLNNFKLFNLGFFSLTLLVFFLTEAISKYFIYYEADGIAVSRFVKAPLMAFIFFVLFKEKKWSTIKSVLIIISFFCLGQLFIEPNFDLVVLLNFCKYIFPITLFTYFNFHNKRRNKNEVFRVYETIILINSIIIFLGFSLDIYWLKTYQGDRFGYNGFLISSATSTYFYIIALSYLFFKYKKASLTKPIFIIVLIAMLLVGTKALYMFLCFFALVYVSVFVEKKMKMFLVSGILVIMAVSFYIIFFEYKVFSNIREKVGLVTSILSYRDRILTEMALPFIRDNWVIPNYLFGGINDISTRPQMSLIDMLYFFGVLGSFYYLKILFQEYFNFSLKKKGAVFIWFIILISILSGNFLINAAVPIYLLVLKETLIEYDT